MARLFLFFKKRLIGDKHTQKAGRFVSILQEVLQEVSLMRDRWKLNQTARSFVSILQEVNPRHTQVILVSNVIQRCRSTPTDGL